MPASTTPIRIGYCLSLTGPVAGNSRSARLAHDIWREDVNSRGGLLDRPVELVCYDDQCRCFIRSRHLQTADGCMLSPKCSHTRMLLAAKIVFGLVPREGSSPSFSHPHVPFDLDHWYTPTAIDTRTLRSCGLLPQSHGEGRLIERLNCGELGVNTSLPSKNKVPIRVFRISSLTSPIQVVLAEQVGSVVEV